MKKTSTTKTQTTVQISKGLHPADSTIDFIKQFARAYSFEPQLPTALGGFINN